MDLEEFTTELARAMGVPRDQVDVTAVLDLAAEAAHAVMRPAAPVAAFIAGYAAGYAAGSSADSSAGWSAGSSAAPSQGAAADALARARSAVEHLTAEPTG